MSTQEEFNRMFGFFEKEFRQLDAQLKVIQKELSEKINVYCGNSLKHFRKNLYTNRMGPMQKQIDEILEWIERRNEL